MLKIENTLVAGFEPALRGMRNAMNSWDKSDSTWPDKIGPEDLRLAKRLRVAGGDHRKFLRMIVVWADITGPLYWWKEYDTYKVGTVANSCSTMHKIAAKEFGPDDFSREHLAGYEYETLAHTIATLNHERKLYQLTKDKDVWWQMIQLLPSSYNQRRTVMLSYEVLNNMCRRGRRLDHKLDEWSVDFMGWARSLPYAEDLIFEETHRGKEAKS